MGRSPIEKFFKLIVIVSLKVKLSLNRTNRRVHPPVYNSNKNGIVLRIAGF